MERRKRFINWAMYVATAFLFMWMFPALVWAEAGEYTNEDGTYSYVINSDDTVTITGFHGRTEIAIPATIAGREVTGIGSSAFQQKELTSVILPESITSIGSAAFYSNRLTSITIPAGVTRIEHYVFEHNKLTSVIVPEGVTSIGSAAFANNELTSVSLPSSITSIEEDAFRSNKLTGVTLPASVTNIGSGAFYGNLLTSVIVPEGVTSIEANVFTENQLTSVTLPSSLTSIGPVAFSRNNLTEITIPSGVTSIGNYAFYGNLLTSVTLPEGITSIESSVFASNQLTSVTLPSSLTSIEASAFSLNKLKEVTIPFGVTSIGDYAFAENDQLMSVTLPTSLASIGEGAFHNNQLTSVSLPEGVTSIGDYAFGNGRLTNVTLPSSLTSIGTAAFANNYLRSVTIPASVTNIGTGAFAGNVATAADLTIYGYRNTAAETYASTNQHTFIPLNTVIYNGNGHTSGMVPIDNNTYVEGQTVTVLGNTGNLAKSGYTFSGWNTQADGRGTNHAVGTTFSMGNNDVALYAKWTALPVYDEPYIPPAQPAPKIDTPLLELKLTIPAGQAGTANFNDVLFLEVPSGATKQDLQLTIQQLIEIQHLLSDKEVLVSGIYEILKNFSENFDKPIKLSIIFDPNKLTQDQTVAVFYYDEENQEWIEVPDGKIEGNRITVEVDHFTKFAVFAVEKEQVIIPSFSDIAGHWAEDDILQAAAEGIVSGYLDGTFKPRNSVTRAEFAVMLMNTLKQQSAGAVLTFRDSAKIGSWAYEAVAQAVQAGIIRGYDDHTFRPDTKITRAEMAAMIANVFGSSIEAVSNTEFADDREIPAWVKGAVALLKQQGIITGKEGNRFDPQAELTRAEAVRVLLKLQTTKIK